MAAINADPPVRFTDDEFNEMRVWFMQLDIQRNNPLYDDDGNDTSSKVRAINAALTDEEGELGWRARELRWEDINDFCNALIGNNGFDNDPTHDPLGYIYDDEQEPGGLKDAYWEIFTYARDHEWQFMPMRQIEGGRYKRSRRHRVRSRRSKRSKRSKRRTTHRSKRRK
jgi:hypothetical protein